MATRSPSQKLLFLSDAHLGGFTKEEDKRIERELIRLIGYCEENRIKIYVLGDLFDYWMEYPGHHPELGSDLRERFRKYNEHFGPTLYITGNHDNWTRSYFAEIGFTVERNYRVITVDGEKIMLLHGDGIVDAGGDIHRPPMHMLLRNRRFIRLFQTLFPPGAGLAIMRWFSKINRFFGKRTTSDPSILNGWAKNRLQATDIRTIITGHDHTPRKLDFPYGTYLNLGNFYNDRTVAYYNNSRFELVCWDDASGQLNDFPLPENRAF